MHNKFVDFRQIFRYNIIESIPKNGTAVNFKLPHITSDGWEVIFMEHFVTWSELIQYSSLLITVVSVLYMIFHDSHKKK
jgi:hypothetical protein